jgi:hypothetical protein
MIILGLSYDFFHQALESWKTATVNPSKSRIFPKSSSQRCKKDSEKIPKTILLAMLPPDYQTRYQTLQQSLQQLQTQVTAANPNPADLRSSFMEAQQWFQQKLIGLGEAELDPADAASVRSYNTEINKHLRLLGMDVTFFQAARQSITAQQRQAQMRDRIQRLISYCDALLNQTSESQ